MTKINHTSANPFIFLFLVDQSGSMQETFPSGKSRSDAAADIINRSIDSLVWQSKSREDFKDIYLGVLGYGGRGITSLAKAGDNFVFNPLSLVEQRLVRTEKRTKKAGEPDGKVTGSPVDFPVWLESHAYGGSPQCMALFESVIAVRDLTAVFPAARVPIVINITDGSPTDGDPEELGKMLLALHTEKGNTLLFNIHLSQAAPQNICFPGNASELPMEYGKLLFRISSPLTENLRRALRLPTISYATKPAGLLYNVNDFGKMAEFIMAITDLKNFV